MATINSSDYEYMVYGMPCIFGDESFVEDHLYYAKVTDVTNGSEHELQYCTQSIEDELASEDGWEDLSYSDQADRIIDQIDWERPDWVDGEEGSKKLLRHVCEKLAKSNGECIEYEGRHYYLTQQAYIDSHSYYEALAICAEDEPDELNYVPCYDINWDVLPEFQEECDEDPCSWHDESLACDWDSPISISESSVCYDLDDERCV